MHHLNDLVDFWSAWLIQASWQAALVVGAIAVLSRLLHRASAQFRYALLVIALAKFATPPFIGLPFGLFSQSRSPMPVEFTIQVDATNAAGIHENSTVSMPPARNAGDFTPNESSDTRLENARIPRDIVGHRIRPAVTPRFHSLAGGICLAHLAGVVFAGFYLRRQYQQIQELIRNSTSAPAEVLQMARKTVVQFRMRSVPDVRISDESDAPFATGLVKPVILLPRSSLELPTDKLRIILDHELVHIRRRDLTVGWIETLLGIFWWFHPGMWWLKRAMRRTREDCCDDVLLSSRLAMPERYCETLIEAAARQTFQPIEPVALGFSNREHAAARRIRRLMDSSLFRTQRLRKTALLLAMIIGFLVLPGMQPFKAPVTKTSLEGMFGWRNLPFDPDPDELAVIKECREVVNRYRSTYYLNGRRMRHFDDPENRDILEAILKRKPNYFYAQHLLGTWYLRNSDLNKGQALHFAALKNAPIVLTQRYRTGRGQALSGVTIEAISIECNRVKNHSLNPELQLEFVDLVTDIQGEIAVPVYDTVYRLSSRSFPEGYDTEMPSLGWFQSKSRFGVLPEVTAWIKHSRPADFTRTAAESALLVDAKGSTTLEVTSGSNLFQIGRVARCQLDGEFNDSPPSHSSGLPTLPRIGNARYMDHAIIDLSNPEPDRYEIRDVTVLESKTKIPLSSFQLAAGVKVVDKARFHLYSLLDNLPEEVDLVMTIRNYVAGAFRMTIPVEEAGVYKQGNVTFTNEYLGAGEHPGWSSSNGFYKEATKRDYLSEMIFKVDAPTGQHFMLMLVTKDGQRIGIETFSPLARLPKPLNEIDHFELVPSILEERIYFEKIALPRRDDRISPELPVVEFPLMGRPESQSTDLFAPIVVRCRTLQGDAYSGTSSSEFGFAFEERAPDKLDPDSKSTIVIDVVGGIAGLKLSAEFFSNSNETVLLSTSSSAMWAQIGAASLSRFSVPLAEIKFVKLRLARESFGK